MSTRFDLDELLHPARAFSHPSEVVRDPDLTLNEKRAILASWASDACALEAAPELREIPGGTRVRFEEIMECLRDLDRQANHAMPGAARSLRKRRLRGLLRRGKPDQGHTLQ
ncbi:hypothetical protein [Pseudorhodoplanes sp.]|uniref:hypothetical protein n=1 Tax=Pseudorhodoplanes sp. TaxID=1934341 RepID=UPI003D097F0D